MTEILTEHKNAMAHILQEYESSYESILFVHGMMSAFHVDLQSTTHTRRAQLKTMTTQAGTELRNITLAMHDDLAKYVEARIRIYSDVSNSLLSKINHLNQSIKDAEHSLRNYHEIRQFMRVKTLRVDDQLSRLSKIDYEINKSLHLKNLKSQYNLHSTKLKDSISEDYHDVNRVRQKADNYRKDHFSMMGYLEENLHREEENINKLIVQCAVVGEIMGSFEGIYEIFRMSLKNNSQEVKISKESIQEELRRSRKNNWNDLISFKSKNMKNSRECQQRYPEMNGDDQQMLIR